MKYQKSKVDFYFLLMILIMLFLILVAFKLNENLPAWEFGPAGIGDSSIE